MEGGTSQPHHPHGHVGQDLDTILGLAMMCISWLWAGMVGLGEAASASLSSSSPALSCRVPQGPWAVQAGGDHR